MDNKAKHQVSVKASPEAFVAQLKKNCKGQTIQRKIAFTNDDVPNYLKYLKRLEEKSRQSRIVVG